MFNAVNKTFVGSDCNTFTINYFITFVYKKTSSDVKKKIKNKPRVFKQ